MSPQRAPKILAALLLAPLLVGCETMKENPYIAGAIGTLGGAAAGAGIGGAVGGKKGAGIGAGVGALAGLIASEVYYFKTRKVGPRDEAVRAHKTKDGIFVEDAGLKPNPTDPKKMAMNVKYALVDPDPKRTFDVNVGGRITPPDGQVIEIPQKTKRGVEQGIQEATMGIELPRDVSPGTYVILANVDNGVHRAESRKTFSLQVRIFKEKGNLYALNVGPEGCPLEYATKVLLAYRKP